MQNIKLLTIQMKLSPTELWFSDTSLLLYLSLSWTVWHDQLFKSYKDSNILCKFKFYIFAFVSRYPGTSIHHISTAGSSMLLSLHFIRSDISQLPLLYIVLFISLFQIYLAIYFVFADLVLFGQYLYYNMCWKRKHKGNNLHFFVLYSLLDLSCPADPIW